MPGAQLALDAVQLPDRARRAEHPAAAPAKAPPTGSRCAGPAQRLPVEGALAGQQQICLPGPVRQLHGIESQLGTGHSGCAQQEQCEADAPSGAGATLDRHGPVGRSRPGAQGHLELLSGGPVGPLLGAEPQGSPLRPEQRGVDVGRGDQLDAGQPFPRSADVDRVAQLGKRATAAAQGIGGGGTEGGQQAGATVGAGRAADADDDALHPRVGGNGDQLADAVRRRCQGVARLRLDQGQPGRAGHLDVRRRGAGVVDQQQLCGDRLAERAGDLDRPQGAAETGVQDFQEARPAVGQRHQVEVIAGGGAPPAFGDRLGRLGRAQRAGEPVWGHHDAHPPILPLPVIVKDLSTRARQILHDHETRDIHRALPVHISPDAGGTSTVRRHRRVMPRLRATAPEAADELREFAESQAGAVSRAQVLAAGMSPGQIEARLLGHDWQPSGLDGVYITFTGPMDYPTKCWAALLYAGEGATLGLGTADGSGAWSMRLHLLSTS